MTDINLLADLKTEEGLSLVAYPDPLSHGAPWTIGYGDATAHRGEHETEPQAEARLATQVAEKEAELDRQFPWWRSLNPARQDVIVDMAFNLGVEKLAGFDTFIGLVKNGHYAAAAQDGLRTAWARQVGRRAHRLMAQLLLGEHTVA